MSRSGVRIADLTSPGVLWRKIRLAVEEANRILTALDCPAPFEADALVHEYLGHGETLSPYVRDTSLFLNDIMDAGKSVLFEGAQGTMLDVDHGTYPFVTSSNSSAGGICTGLGIGPKRVHGLLGVMKAYCTRVGNGPFPTELKDALGEAIREKGSEYGVSTGRPRRCGWFDAVVTRYSARVSGIDMAVITRLDILDGMEELKICTAYRYKGETISQFPADLEIAENVEPVYETLPGWKTSTAGCRRWKELPQEAKSYAQRLQELTGVEIAIISTGPDRKETIMMESRKLQEWFGDLVY
jgi:adenylosuccinate synthase